MYPSIRALAGSKTRAKREMSAKLSQSRKTVRKWLQCAQSSRCCSFLV